VVVYGITDVNVSFEGKVGYGGIEVEDVRRSWV
jgi:hypothetical protein